MVRSRPGRYWWEWAIIGLSALGLALSGYLGWRYIIGKAAIGCGAPGAPGCDKVLTSRWSTIGGVLPVSGVAVGVYLAMLVAALNIGQTSAASVRRLAWRAILVLAGTIAGSAVWFTVLQRWVIGAFCPYCMAAHVTGLILAAFIVWRALRNEDDLLALNWTTSIARDRSTAMAAPGETTSPTAAWHLRPFSPWVIFSFGLALAGLVATSQALFQRSAVYQSGEANAAPVTADPRLVPLVGLPEATYVISMLFDYKCPHCQQIHFLLEEAIRRYGGTLAFAICPTPLSRNCNPHVPRDSDEFKDSCELAKISLAVWVAKRDAFPEFDRWMFSYESGEQWQPRTVDAAREKAAELVGEAKFDAAARDPWVTRYLHECIRLYGDSGGNAIPKLVYHSRWVTPEAPDADALISIIQRVLAVPAP